MSNQYSNYKSFTCRQCHKTITVPDVYRYRKSIYCSNACSQESRRIYETCDDFCFTCKNPIKVKGQYTKRNHRNFCSKKCLHGVPIEIRFFSKVEKTDKPPYCWIWKGSIGKIGGYGKFYAEGYYVDAHRFSYKLHYGDFPKELQVNHSCDVRACVLPVHLWLGTQQDNIDDCRNKKRHIYGEKFHGAKLTEKDVLEIWALKGKKFQREVAELYNISDSNVSQIWLRKSWKHLTLTLP